MIRYPDFKPIEIDDRGLINGILRSYAPSASEYTFTNLFIWREFYKFQWSMYKDWLLIISGLEGSEFALQPVGPPSRREAACTLLEWLKKEKKTAAPVIKRADSMFIREIENSPEILFEPNRDDFDYVYNIPDLINLSGKGYHGKRNHINKFLRTNTFTYASMTEEHLDECGSLAKEWCLSRRCDEDMTLMGEWSAIKEALANFRILELTGGVVFVDGRIRAFALGELLNKETAVVHIEKAGPESPALFTLINQQFCEQAWSKVPFINREQDLGIPGLRKAKLSYRPCCYVEKYNVSLF